MLSIQQRCNIPFTSFGVQFVYISRSTLKGHLRTCPALNVAGYFRDLLGPCQAPGQHLQCCGYICNAVDTFAMCFPVPCPNPCPNLERAIVYNCGDVAARKVIETLKPFGRLCMWRSTGSRGGQLAIYSTKVQYTVYILWSSVCVY